MLFVIMFAAFLASHFLLRETRTVNATQLEEALVIGAFVGVSLLLASAGASNADAWRRPLISVAYGVFLSAFFEFAWIAKELEIVPSSREWLAVLLIGSFALWGVFGHSLMAIVFGSRARDEYWEYVKETYSTFRKS